MPRLRAAALLLSCLAGLTHGSASFAGTASQAEPGAEAGGNASPGWGRQILGGTAYGGGGLLLGGAAGAALLSAGCFAWGEDCGFAGLGGAFVGGALGFAGGFPLGVYRFGNDASASGSLGWTYLAAGLGSAAGFGTWAAVTRLRDEDAVFQSIMLGLAGAPIGALIGYNATHAAKAPAPRVSVFPQAKGGWACVASWSFGGPR